MLEGHRTEREEPEREKQKYKYKMKLYLCEGYDPLFGTVRDIIQATCVIEANNIFLFRHGIPSLHTQIENL